MKLFRIYTLSFMVLPLLTACSLINPTYKITIASTSTNSEIIKNPSYVLKPMKKELEANGLWFQKRTQALHEILEVKGYKRVSNEMLAEQIIYVDYGIVKDHEEKEVYVDPELSFAGYHPTKPYTGVGVDALHGDLRHYDNDFYKGTFRSHTTIYVYYDRYLNLVAKDRFSKDLWRVNVSSIGESKEFHKILPFLIEESKPFIGTTTKIPVYIELKVR